MLFVRNVAKLKKIIKQKKNQNVTIGFVPTMGYLHEGHLSLIRIARKKCQFLAVSIFVNPIQFGPKEDFKKYPRNLKKDLRMLKDEGVDLVFYPSVKDMYPADYKTSVYVKELSKILCGASRPHHFQGVTTIVLKLLNVVQPDIMAFGKKDFQQAIIIKKMVEDLHLDVKITMGKIIREKDGLALSSRNIYLSKTQRKNAVVLHESLKWAKQAFKKGLRNPKETIKRMKMTIKEKNGRIDYVEAVDPCTLQPVKKLQKGTLIALAAFFGKTRLIDNTIL